MQENAALLAKLNALEKKLPADKGSEVKTPPGRKRPAPSPKSVRETAASKRKAAPPPDDGDDDDDGRDDASDEGSEPAGSEAGSGEGESPPEEVMTEAAKNNRLRRVCEKKPSGRCHVPDHIHQQWAKGGAERLALREQLETMNWDKDGQTRVSMLVLALVNLNNSWYLCVCLPARTSL